MTQGVLAIQYEADRTGTGLTAFGSVPLYIELLKACGLSAAVKREMSVCGAAGWLDVHMVTAALALNLAGGDCVEDLERLEQDSGFTSVLRSAERFLLSLREHREMGCAGARTAWISRHLPRTHTPIRPPQGRERPAFAHPRPHRRPRPPKKPPQQPVTRKPPVWRAPNTQSMAPAGAPYQNPGQQTNNKRFRSGIWRREGIDSRRAPAVRTIGMASPRIGGRSEKGEVRSGMGDRRYHVPNHILGAG